MFNYRAVAGVLVAVVAVSAGCSQASMDDAARNNPKSMTLSRSEVSLLPGATARITASFRNEFDDPTSVHPTLLWLSSNPAVATVQVEGENSDGVITAVSSGTATITATYGVLQSSVAVTVTEGIWVLDSVSGASTGTWTRDGGTLVGSLVFDPPQEVTEGGFYDMSVTFVATLTSNSSTALRWNINSYLVDVSNNPDAPYAKFDGKFINANPMVTDSITTTVVWPVSAAVHGNLQTLKYKARGDGEQGAPVEFLARTAYYHKLTL